MEICRHCFKIFIALLIILVAMQDLNAQQGGSSGLKLPDITVKTIDNRSFNTSDISNEGKPIILIFWKSCCAPNIKMLDGMNEVYAEWQEETGVIIYAVSIDDSRSMAGIAPLVNGKGWEFPVLLDVNSDLKRAMNVYATPHLFILNDKKEVVWQKMTYAPGDETEIHRILVSFNK